MRIGYVALYMHECGSVRVSTPEIRGIYCRSHRFSRPVTSTIDKQPEDQLRGLFLFLGFAICSCIASRMMTFLHSTMYLLLPYCGDLGADHCWIALSRRIRNFEISFSEEERRNVA
ncbi:uncharacterized protein LOC135164476 [Diachasmimorpha longicaudata]|uniref:uncharacterized protein LOC135164476 n=1 Tax=Diachasmimorpha longicaudata TaxID=58733 RepID=UPI0030B90126